MPEAFPINSDNALQAGLVRVQELYDRHKYVTLSFRIGEDRSLDQNSLFKKWARVCAAHYLSKAEKEVTKGEHEGMCRVIKRDFYNETAAPWMVHKVSNPKNPQEQKTDYTSSGDWKRAEMSEVLTWLQATAGRDGLVLESEGQFAKIQREAIS